MLSLPLSLSHSDFLIVVQNIKRNQQPECEQWNTKLKDNYPFEK